MKELEVGTLVFHKDYGQGIVKTAHMNNNGIYKVLFVDNVDTFSVHRSTLFAVDDKVYYSNSPNEFCKKDQVGFYKGYVPFRHKPNFYVSHNQNSLPFTIYDIVHADEEPTIEITVKVNGEEVKLSSIPEETLLEIRKNT